MHWATCGGKTKCLYDGAEFSSLEELRTHWMQQCNSIEVLCQACSTKVNRKMIGGHKCGPFVDLAKQLETHVNEYEIDNLINEQMTKANKLEVDNPVLQKEIDVLETSN